MHKETSLQLFKECDFARTSWFGSNWGLRMDAIIVSSSSDLVKFIVAPAEVLSGRVTIEIFTISNSGYCPNLEIKECCLV